MLTLYVPDPKSVPVIGCSPPSWMCQLALLEKQAPHEIVWLDFARGEHKTPAMRAKNPRGTIPVLEHDGVVVHETFAILQYIDAFCPGKGRLSPEDREGAARALVRLHEAAALKDRGMALFAHLMRGGDAARAAPLALELERELDRWEEYVDPAPSDRVTLADLAVFTYVATAERLGLPLARWPNIAAFSARVRARPSAKATWPETWSGPPAALYPT